MEVKKSRVLCWLYKLTLADLSNEFVSIQAQFERQNLILNQ